MKRLGVLSLILLRHFNHRWRLSKRLSNKLNEVNSLMVNQQTEHRSLSVKERLLNSSHQVLQWLRTPEGSLFSEWLRDVRLRENKKLMEAEKQELVFRAQGSVGIIDLVLSLEEDLQQYQRDLHEGERKRLKEGADGVGLIGRTRAR